MQGLGLGDTPNGKCSRDIKGLGTRLHNRGRVKRDQRILIDVEEIVALQRPVLESAPCIHTGCLDLNVQHSTLRTGRSERKRSIPLIERTLDGYRRRHLKRNLAFYWRNLENRNVRRRLCRCWSCQKAKHCEAKDNEVQADSIAWPSAHDTSHFCNRTGYENGVRSCCDFLGGV